MSITVTSTTDSETEVQAVQGGAKASTETKGTEEKVEAKGETSAAEAEEEAAEKFEASEAQEDEESESEEEGETEDKKPKKKGFKKRIAKLSAKLSATKEEAEFWRQEALKNQAKPKVEEKVEAKAESGRPKSEDFEKHEDYVEALADWKVEQKLSKRDAETKQEALKTEFERANEAHLSRVQEFAKKHGDFNETLGGVDDIPISQALSVAIFESDLGPAIMYELAKNPEEYERINSLSKDSVLKEIGKLEAKLSVSTTTESKKVSTTKAPPPVKPVGGKSVGSAKDPSEMSFQEYKKWREANSAA